MNEAAGSPDRVDAPILVGVLNVTPDSFSDGGRYTDVAAAVAAGCAMAAEGAAWIDVGGESTRPGSHPVTADEELARVVPVITALAPRLPEGIRISIDTYKAATARAALAAGASVVNDVSGGLLDPAILRVTAEGGAIFVAGHLRGRPETMMDQVAFADVVAEVTTELGARVAAARAAGCREVWADPGIGFGKLTPHNLALLAGLGTLRSALGVRVMVGVSRKRFIGELTGRAIEDRLAGSVAAATIAVLQGADALRVHDVAATRDAVRVAYALRRAVG